MAKLLKTIGGLVLVSSLAGNTLHPLTECPSRRPLAPSFAHVFAGEALVTSPISFRQIQKDSPLLGSLYRWVKRDLTKPGPWRWMTESVQSFLKPQRERTLVGPNGQRFGSVFMSDLSPVSSAEESEPSPIRKVELPNREPIYVVAPAVFTLLSKNDPSVYFYPSPVDIGEGASMETMEILAVVREAELQGKSGAAELMRLIESGPKIFISGDALMPDENAPSYDPLSPFFDHNDDELVFVAVWKAWLTARLMSWIQDEPEQWAALQETFKILSSPRAPIIFPQLSEGHLQLLAEEPINYLVGVRNRAHVNTVLREVFPLSVSGTMIDLLARTRPTLEETYILRADADGLLGSWDGSESYYRDVIGQATQRGLDEIIELLEATRKQLLKNSVDVSAFEELIALLRIAEPAKTPEIRQRMNYLFAEIGFFEVIKGFGNVILISVGIGSWLWGGSLGAPEAAALGAMLLPRKFLPQPARVRSILQAA